MDRRDLIITSYILDHSKSRSTPSKCRCFESVAKLHLWLFYSSSSDPFISFWTYLSFLLFIE